MRARNTTRRTAKPPARTGVWWVAVPVVVLLVAAFIVSAYTLGRSRDVTTPPATPATTSPTTSGTQTSGSTASPATAAPSVAATASVPAPTATPTAAEPLPATTTVAIVTAGWGDGDVSVSGYATVVEDGGTCTLTVTNGDVSVTESHAATADAATTSCGVITVHDARLTPGTWQATLAYTSATSTGVSDPTSITIG